MRNTQKIAMSIMLVVGFGFLTPSAATAGCDNTKFADSTFYVATQGGGSYTQTLNGVLYTEGQIGVMADRILWTETQIGEMSNRIVYVTQFSQTNSVTATYMLTNIVYLGPNNNGYQYSATVTQIPSLPF